MRRALKNKSRHNEQKSKAGINPFRVLIFSALIGTALGVTVYLFNPSPFQIETLEIEENVLAEQSFALSSQPNSTDLSLEMAPDLPVFPGGRPTRLGERAYFRDLTHDMSWYTTSSRPEEVVQWYKDSLLEAGYPMVDGELPGGAHYVGYTNPTTHEAHTVTVLGFLEGTVVIPSLSKITGDLKKGDEAIPEDLPHPSSASNTAVLTFSKMGTISYTVVATSPEAVSDLYSFYNKELTSSGWTIEPFSATTTSSSRISAKRGSLSAEIILARDFEQGFPTTRIHIQMLKRA